VKELPSFLKNKLSEQKSYTETFPQEIKQFLIDYANYYSWHLGEDIKNIWKLVKQNITYLPECALNGCTKKCYIKITKDNCVIQNGCCPNHHKRNNNLTKYGVEHTLQLKEIRTKITLTNLTKYGSASPLSNIAIQQKAKETLLEKYGVENAMQNNETVEKVMETKFKKYGLKNYNNLKGMQQTLLEKYNATNPMQVKEFKEKSVETCLKKYGVPNNLKSKSTKNKIRNTNLAKYGVENVLANAEIKTKAKNTIITKFGVEYPLQNPKIYSKMVTSSYKFKEYTWTSGKLSKLQGYEFLVLKELEESGYIFDDILTEPKDMPEIWYEFEGNKHRYYPDFYIKKENLIIEVKSHWTLQLHSAKNQAKFEAVKKLGFNFRLDVR